MSRSGTVSQERVILIKETEVGKIGCVVPLHKTLELGTLMEIRQQGIRRINQWSVDCECLGCGHYWAREYRQCLVNSA